MSKIKASIHIFSLIALMAATPSKAVTVTNPDDSVWSRLGWNLGWATGCNALPYSATMDPHRKVKTLRDKELISERDYKEYITRRNEFLRLESSGCEHAKVKRAVDQINRYLESIDK